FSSRRRHTRSTRDWSSDVCSSDLGEALAARGGLVLVACGLFVFLTAPLVAIFIRAVEDKSGTFAGLANFATYFASPAFERSAGKIGRASCRERLTMLRVARA